MAVVKKTYDHAEAPAFKPAPRSLQFTTSLAEENNKILKDKVDIIRSLALNQNLDEEQTNKVKERLGQLSDAYQFVLNELRGYQNSLEL